MRVAHVADVHLANHKVHGGEMRAGLNDRARLVLGALEEAYKKGKAVFCEAMVINGDLFDTAKPSPQLIAAVQHVIGSYPELRTYVLMGNHDMESAAVGDNALGPLSPVARVLEKPTIITLESRRSGGDRINLWAVPFQPGRAAEWLPVVLAGMQGTLAQRPPASTQMLALHLGLQDGNTPPWLQDSHDSVPVSLVASLMAEFGIRTTYAGNWHEPKTWEVDAGRIVQVGTLCPTGWDNPGLQFGTMAIFDSVYPDKGQELSVPGPRFLSKVSEVIDLKARGRGWTPFVRLKADASDREAMESIVQDYKAEGICAELIVDDVQARVAARTAAGASRGAESVDQAVAAYIEQMPLEDPEIRQDVLARVKSFLAAAE